MEHFQNSNAPKPNFPSSNSNEIHNDFHFQDFRKNSDFENYRIDATSMTLDLNSNNQFDPQFHKKNFENIILKDNSGRFNSSLNDISQKGFTFNPDIIHNVHSGFISSNLNFTNPGMNTTDFIPSESKNAHNSYNFNYQNSNRQNVITCPSRITNSDFDPQSRSNIGFDGSYGKSVNTVSHSEKFPFGYASNNSISELNRDSLSVEKDVLTHNNQLQNKNSGNWSIFQNISSNQKVDTSFRNNTTFLDHSIPISRNYKDSFESNYKFKTNKLSPSFDSRSQNLSNRSSYISANNHLKNLDSNSFISSIPLLDQYKNGSGYADDNFLSPRIHTRNNSSYNNFNSLETAKNFNQLGSINFSSNSNFPEAGSNLNYIPISSNSNNSFPLNSNIDNHYISHSMNNDYTQNVPKIDKIAGVSNPHSKHSIKQNVYDFKDSRVDFIDCLPSNQVNETNCTQYLSHNSNINDLKSNQKNINFQNLNPSFIYPLKSNYSQNSYSNQLEFTDNPIYNSNQINSGSKLSKGSYTLPVDLNINSYNYIPSVLEMNNPSSSNENFNLVTDYTSTLDNSNILPRDISLYPDYQPKFNNIPNFMRTFLNPNLLNSKNTNIGGSKTTSGMKIESEDLKTFHSYPINSNIPENILNYSHSLDYNTNPESANGSQTNFQVSNSIQPNMEFQVTDSSLLPIFNFTTNLVPFYRSIDPVFEFVPFSLPRRSLTIPKLGVLNDGYDNEHSDYIMFVNDIIGEKEGHQYVILESLGSGTFGQVAKCRHISSGKLFAVKVVKNNPAYYNQSMMEVHVLNELKNTLDPSNMHHFVQIHEHFLFRNHLVIVNELLSMNVYEMIKQNNYVGLSTKSIKMLSSQLLDSLIILKKAKIIHCDLKPENIMLKDKDSFELKVIDFGSACYEDQSVFTYIQSRFYRSPEVILGLPYNTAIDMWSFGCIVAELFLGLPIFPGTSEFNQLDRIVKLLGLPPFNMLQAGKKTNEYFKRISSKGWRIKTNEEYQKDTGRIIDPGNQLMNSDSILDLIMKYPYKESMNKQQIEIENNNRLILVDFLTKSLDINPETRLTPEEAVLHPFMNKNRFNQFQIYQDSKINPASLFNSSNFTYANINPIGYNVNSHFNNKLTSENPLRDLKGEYINNNTRSKQQTTNGMNFKIEFSHNVNLLSKNAFDQSSKTKDIESLYPANFGQCSNVSNSILQDFSESNLSNGKFYSLNSISHSNENPSLKHSGFIPDSRDPVYNGNNYNSQILYPGANINNYNTDTNSSNNYYTQPSEASSDEQINSTGSPVSLFDGPLLSRRTETNVTLVSEKSANQSDIFVDSDMFERNSINSNKPVATDGDRMYEDRVIQDNTFLNPIIDNHFIGDSITKDQISNSIIPFMRKNYLFSSLNKEELPSNNLMIDLTNDSVPSSSNFNSSFNSQYRSHNILNQDQTSKSHDLFEAQISSSQDIINESEKALTLNPTSNFINNPDPSTQRHFFDLGNSYIGDTGAGPDSNNNEYCPEKFLQKPSYKFNSPNRNSFLYNNQSRPSLHKQGTDSDHKVLYKKQLKSPLHKTKDSVVKKSKPDFFTANILNLIKSPVKNGKTKADFEPSTTIPVKPLDNNSPVLFTECENDRESFNSFDLSPDQKDDSRNHHINLKANDLHSSEDCSDFNSTRERINKPTSLKLLSPLPSNSEKAFSYPSRPVIDCDQKELMERLKRMGKWVESSNDDIRNFSEPKKNVDYITYPPKIIPDKLSCKNDADLSSYKLCNPASDRPFSLKESRKNLVSRFSRGIIAPSPSTLPSPSSSLLNLNVFSIRKNRGKEENPIIPANQSSLDQHCRNGVFTNHKSNYNDAEVIPCVEKDYNCSSESNAIHSTPSLATNPYFFKPRLIDKPASPKNNKRHSTSSSISPDSFSSTEYPKISINSTETSPDSSGLGMARNHRKYISEDTPSHVKHSSDGNMVMEIILQKLIKSKMNLADNAKSSSGGSDRHIPLNSSIESNPLSVYDSSVNLTNTYYPEFDTNRLNPGLFPNANLESIGFVPALSDLTHSLINSRKSGSSYQKLDITQSSKSQILVDLGNF
ncbi:Serine/threonine-protein kinase ppk15 [Smittium mucronatum]|uniref:Serine/threonine-protein kinase ppk15 n=1 Tax=Smittium mucronatum TaxID=133383 RepID=A0A1R0GYE1_9FUNG|nr:Serine/threonine-protein kinase ppk15 [Smittium mucronatum]